MDPTPHRGWYSRGYLPHFDDGSRIQTVNFRLDDAVPADVVAQWRRELDLELDAEDPRKAILLRKRVAMYEDAGHGECWLRDRELAERVEQALLFFHLKRYTLEAWCIMPNHVHAILDLEEGWTLDRVLHSWKSYSAKEINLLLQRRGRVWARESYDRYIRDEQHFAAAVRYVEENPVAAGLVGRPEEWRFSSAWWRSRGWASSG